MQRHLLVDGCLLVLGIHAGLAASNAVPVAANPHHDVDDHAGKQFRNASPCSCRLVLGSQSVPHSCRAKPCYNPEE